MLQADSSSSQPWGQRCVLTTVSTAILKTAPIPHRLPCEIILLGELLEQFTDERIPSPLTSPRSISGKDILNITMMLCLWFPILFYATILLFLFSGLSLRRWSRSLYLQSQDITKPTELFITLQIFLNTKGRKKSNEWITSSLGIMWRICTPLLWSFCEVVYCMEVLWKLILYVTYSSAIHLSIFM